MKIISIFIAIMLLAGCSSNENTKPLSEAYNDGFLVVLIDGETVAGIKLTYADIILPEKQWSTLLLNEEDIPRIEKQLYEDYRKDVNTSYPKVNVHITPVSTDEQKIDLTFRYKKNTHVYSYRAFSKKAVPIKSVSTTAKGTQKVKYEHV